MKVIMYYVYAMRNEGGRVYVGMSKNVDRRVAEHNAGMVFSTKGYRPWTVIFIEQADNRIVARAREKYWKSGVGKEQLKRIPQ